MQNRKEAAGWRPAAMLSTHKNPIEKSQGLQFDFDRSALPKPSALLDKLAIRYHQKGAWLTVYCPFHANGRESNPSLGIHSVSGHYRCHACNAKGGDVIAFYRAITGSGFLDALKMLGVRHG